MNKSDDNKIQRRALMTGVGAAALAGIVAGTAGPAQAQQHASAFQPARHDEDAWFDALGGNHRVFVDTSTPLGGQDALRYAMNIMNAHLTAYGGVDTDYAMIVCYRHASTPFGYNDSMWEKYGDILNERMGLSDPDTNASPKRNILNVARGPFSGATIDAMVARGVHFAICGTATRGMAGAIAAETGQEADKVNEELIANGIPNAHFVSAGVMGMTRAQEYGYSLLYAG
jgi:intracellular sulfur oxidation DsrE/DsrF family protein